MWLEFIIGKKDYFQPSIDSGKFEKILNFATNLAQNLRKICLNESHALSKAFDAMRRYGRGVWIYILLLIHKCWIEGVTFLELHKSVCKCTPATLAVKEH